MVGKSSAQLGRATHRSNGLSRGDPDPLDRPRRRSGARTSVPRGVAQLHLETRLLIPEPLTVEEEE